MPLFFFGGIMAKKAVNGQFPFEALAIEKKKPLSYRQLALAMRKLRVANRKRIALIIGE